MKISKLIDDEEWLKDFYFRVRELIPTPVVPLPPPKKWDIEEAMRFNEGVFNEFRNGLAQRNIRFIDPRFGPSSGALGTAAPPFSVAWLRPPLLFRRSPPPVLLTRKQHEPYRMARSEYGSKSLAAVIHAVSFNDALRCRVMPDDQGFSDSYAGIFRFRFWNFDEWVPIVIDDRLPVKKKTKEFFFNHFSNMPDVWVCLVEKAYAKFVGGYGEIKKLNLLDILRSFTGGVGEFYNIKVMKTVEMTSIKIGLNRGSVIMALVSNGNDFCYNVRGIYKEKYVTDGEIFVRLCNPFDINDKVDNLKRRFNLSEEEMQESQIRDHPNGDLIERNCLDLAPDYKNTTWTTLTDFRLNFKYLLICNPRSGDLSHNTDGHWCSLQKWNFFTVSSRWVSKETYGSPCPETSPISCNSQIRFRVTTPDYEGEWKTSRCTLIASLLQRGRTRQELNSISLLVYNLNEPEKEPFKLSQKFFDQHEPLYQSFEYPEFETSARLYLDPGTYVLIPVTDNYEMEEDYLMTLCSVNPVEHVLPLLKSIADANLVEATIECPDSILMGESIQGFVYVTNKYDMPKRICYVVLTERILQVAKPIACKTSFIKLGPMLSLVTPVTITFFEYAELVELKLKECSVRIKCYCYTFDDQGLAVAEKTVKIALPRLEIIPVGSVLVGEECTIEASWTNTLPLNVELGTFRLDNSLRLKHRVGTVEPNKTARHLFKTCYFRGGWNEIIVDFTSHILDVHKTVRLMIEDSDFF